MAGPAEPAVAELHVVTGPGTGEVVPLRPGTVRIGRGSGAQVRLPDAEVSREHVSLTVGIDRVLLRDLFSANGSVLDGRPVPAGEQVGLPYGATVRLGSTTLELHPPGPPAACLPDGVGHLLVNRAPRSAIRFDPGVVRFPDRTTSGSARSSPSWTGLLVPLLLAIPMMLIWRQPALLLLAVAGPVAVGVQHLVERRRARRTDRRLAGLTLAAETAAREQLVGALATDLADLVHAHPAATGIASISAGPTVRLWERRDGDGLTVRLGTGQVTARVAVTGDTAPAAPVHDRGPVLLDLAGHRMVGLSGGPNAVLGLTRSLIGQLAVLHAPRDLGLAVLTGVGRPGPDWDWVRRLPHHRELDRAVPSAGSPGRLLVVLDGVAPARRAVLTAPPPVAAAGPAPIYLCLEPDRTLLPQDCSAMVTCGSEGAELFCENGSVRFDLEPVSRPWAVTLSHRLAPLREVTTAAEHGLPVSLHWVSLLTVDGLDPTDPTDVARGWPEHAELSAVLGVHRDGRFGVDLRRDGPHALVAGTTGSGKSELLLTWVTALAVANSPELLHLLLVDYKGGAAFSSVQGLPHVAGVLTDLDPHEARRALAGLRAEIRRRERVLRERDATDLDDYERRRLAAGRSWPALPRLVVVVDEFRVLADELPGFVPELVRVAAVGRSLGLHLVLATQRPGGAVSADLRANVNLRIALRVRDRAESDDVLDVPLAADLDPAAPGRAVARVGPGRPVVFQTGRVAGGRRSGTAPRVQVVGPGPHPAAEMDAGPQAPADGPDDLARVVEAVAEAARRRGLPTAHAPWLPPLPDRLRSAELVASGGRCPDCPDGPDDAPDDDGPGGPDQVLLGLVDHPDRPAQHGWAWRLGTGNLGIAGGPRSGRTGAVRTLAAGSPVPVYVIDGSGELTDLAGLPVVAAVLAVEDVERCERLLRRLAALVRDRAGAPGAVRTAALLLVDGWEQVVRAWTPYDHGAAVDDLLSLLRDGPGAGVVAAVTGGRAVAAGPVGAQLGRRLVLPMADPGEEVIAGIPPTLLARRRVPGRAVVVGAPGAEADGLLLQVALPPDRGCTVEVGRGRVRRRPDPPAGARSLRSTCRCCRPFSGSAIWSAVTPPAPSRRTARPPPGCWSGSAGDDVRPLRLPLSSGGGVLVAGSAGSGRSTALRVLAAALGEAGSRSVLVDSWDPTAAEQVERHPDACVLVDGLLPLPPDLEDALRRHLYRGRLSTGEHPAGSSLDPPPGRPSGRPAVGGPAHHGGTVALVCEPGQLVSAYSGLLAELRVHRTGLLLGALGPGDGEGFGLRLPPRPAGPPGRGLLVVRGRARTVQLARPDPDQQPAHRAG